MSRTITTDIEIDAEPAAVWAVLTDLDRFAEWNPFMVRAGGRVAPGERLEVHLQPVGAGRGMTFRPRVLVAEPGRELRWLGRLGFGGLFDGEHYFVLQERSGGRSRLVHGETFRGLLVPLMGGALSRTEVSFRALNQALKERVESSAGAAGAGRGVNCV